MDPIIVNSEVLNLPEPLAAKVRGKKVELVLVGESITINPVSSHISSARGMLKGRNLGTQTIIEHKHLEKSLEHGS